jgi:hypothetical protein
MATTLQDRTTPNVNTSVPQPSNEVEELDCLDWDIALLTPPDRPAGKVSVRLSFQGRSQPPVLAMPEESKAASNK